MFIAGNILRLVETVLFWMILAEYGAQPLYIAATGAFWVVAGILIAWSLWQGKTWGWIAALVGSIGYTAWYWFDRLILQKPHANWPFILAANVVVLLLIITILFSNGTKKFLKRSL